MTWHVFRLIYRLEGPLHVGWRRIGNLQQTRPYVTGRAWWGAVTAALASLWLGHSSGTVAYKDVASFVCAHLRFGYFFPSVKEHGEFRSYLPRIQGRDLCYTSEHGGSLTEPEFAYRFLSSRVATAVHPSSMTAEEGLLYETEFLSPWGRPLRESTIPSAVYASGHLFVQDGNPEICLEDRDVKVRKQSLFQNGGLLTWVSIGGERRYGYGRLRLVQVDPAKSVFGWKIVSLDGEAPKLEVQEANKKVPLPAHCEVDGLEADGWLEPLVGREWQAQGPGQCVSKAVICWAPGSGLHAKGGEGLTLAVGPYGVWKKDMPGKPS